MDLTNLKDILSYSDPIEMPVSELLTGVYVFSIPSYQRGYRWESSEIGIKDNDVKQVDDLLNDLTAFANANAHNSANYYLQPLMVKPKQTQGTFEWDVLDGQQRLTTLLLVLRCINEKLYSNPLPLYSIRYENRKQLDFSKITYDQMSTNYDYPVPTDNLDSYFVRKAKDRIERWYEVEIKNDQSLQDKIKELLFYPDKSRTGVSSPPSLRAKFIWYNVEPISATFPPPTGNRLHDIEIFNRLNRGKISLTNSELIKALFLLCIKNSPFSGSSLMSPDTLVRKWDEMGKKFQNDEFWKMIAPKDTEYSNRMDLLFDFIRDCLGSEDCSSYRFYYGKMHPLLLLPDIRQVENLWNDIKLFFDTLCKWHENVQMHNYIGFLVDNGERISSIYYSYASSGQKLADVIKDNIGITDINDIETLNYQNRNDFVKIRKILLLFNVLTCDKYGQRFPFNLYRDNSYDVEHINSQTDNPIEKIDEKREWIVEHAIACLWYDRTEKNAQGFTQAAIEARDLIIKGIKLLKAFQKNGKDLGEEFKPYREEVENYYARGSNSDNRHLIGNLTLLNSSINREYKNALFPKKLRILKRSDQEGAYIPLCTKYMFLKYYSNPQGNVSAFNMMRWRDEDQEEYIKAIKDTIKIII